MQHKAHKNVLMNRWRRIPGVLLSQFCEVIQGFMLDLTSQSGGWFLQVERLTGSSVDALRDMADDHHCLPLPLEALLNIQGMQESVWSPPVYENELVKLIVIRHIPAVKRVRPGEAYFRWLSDFFSLNYNSQTCSNFSKTLEFTAMCGLKAVSPWTRNWIRGSLRCLNWPRLTYLTLSLVQYKMLFSTEAERNSSGAKLQFFNQSFLRGTPSKWRIILIF